MSRFEETLKNAGISDNVTLVKVNYGLEVLKNETSKFIIMLMFFWCIGYYKEYIFGLAMLIPIRLFSGGLHMKSKIGCQVFSFLLIFLSVCVLPKLNMEMYFYYAMQVLTVVITSVISPVKNPHRPIKTKRRYTNLKSKTIVFVVINSLIIFVTFINNAGQYYYVGVWILMLNTLQLFISWIYSKAKGGSHDFCKENNH